MLTKSPVANGPILYCLYPLQHANQYLFLYTSVHLELSLSCTVSNCIRAAQNGTCCEVAIGNIWELPSMNWYTHNDLELGRQIKAKLVSPPTEPPKKGSSAAWNFQFDSRQIHLLQLPSLPSPLQQGNDQTGLQVEGVQVIMTLGRPGGWHGTGWMGFPIGYFGIHMRAIYDPLMNHQPPNNWILFKCVHQHLPTTLT